MFKFNPFKKTEQAPISKVETDTSVDQNSSETLSALRKLAMPVLVMIASFSQASGQEMSAEQIQSLEKTLTTLTQEETALRQTYESITALASKQMEAEDAEVFTRAVASYLDKIDSLAEHASDKVQFATKDKIDATASDITNPMNETVSQELAVIGTLVNKYKLAGVQNISTARWETPEMKRQSPDQRLRAFYSSAPKEYAELKIMSEEIKEVLEAQEQLSPAPAVKITK